MELAQPPRGLAGVASGGSPPVAAARIVLVTALSRFGIALLPTFASGRGYVYRRFMEPTYQQSAVALLDVLGFKGIERHADPTIVAGALKTARKTLESATTAVNQLGLHSGQLRGRVRIKKAWFSDTICVVAQPPQIVPEWKGTDREEDVRAALVDIVSFCCGYMLRTAAQSPERPLAFRGVITVGNTIVEDDDIYFGEAIAEAASLYELAEGAFVWLSPGACSAGKRLLRTLGHRQLIPYTVPLKGGQTIDTRVVSPYIDTLSTPPHGAPIRTAFENVLAGDRLDIAIKRQNTLRFLDHVIETEPPPAQREHEP